MRSFGLFVAFSACSGVLEAPEPVPEPKRPVVMALTPTLMTPASVETPFGSVEAVGVTSADDVVVVTDGGVFELGVLGPSRRRLYAAAGDPTSLGAVGSILPRANGGAWLTSENGLFAVDTQYVWRSGWSGRGTVRAVTELSSGALSGTWVLSDELMRTRDGGTELLTVPGLTSIDGVAVTRDGTKGFVTGGGQLRVVSVTKAGVLQAVAPNADVVVTNVRRPVAGRSVLAAISDEGVVVLDGDVWTVRTGIAPLALTADGTSNTVWARTATQLWALDGDVSRVADVGPVVGQPAPSLDAYGDVLIPSSRGVMRFKTGVERVAVNFTELTAVLRQRCSSCHFTYSERATFLPHAEAALARVKSNDMPRCENGARCAEPLPAAEVALLEGWIRGGKTP